MGTIKCKIHDTDLEFDDEDLYENAKEDYSKCRMLVVLFWFKVVRLGIKWLTFLLIRF